MKAPSLSPGAGRLRGIAGEDSFGCFAHLAALEAQTILLEDKPRRDRGGRTPFPRLELGLASGAKQKIVSGVPQEGNRTGQAETCNGPAPSRGIDASFGLPPWIVGKPVEAGARDSGESRVGATVAMIGPAGGVLDWTVLGNFARRLAQPFLSPSPGSVIHFFHLGRS